MYYTAIVKQIYNRIKYIHCKLLDVIQSIFEDLGDLKLQYVVAMVDL